MRKDWWREFPGRLRRELRELRRAHIKYEIDRDAFREGKLQLELTFEYASDSYRLRAFYPETFPFFRVEVEAPDLLLPRHQNPFSKSLCLIGRRTENWKPSDTLAALITEQFPLLLRAASAGDRSTTKDIEEDQGEPATTFYPFLAESSILVDGSWKVRPEYLQGWLRVGIETLRSQRVRGAVLEVCDATRKPIATADTAIQAMYPRKQIWVRWTRHADFIQTDEAAKFFDEIVAHDPTMGQFTPHRSKSAALDLSGILMREEVAREIYSDVWLFVLRETAAQRRGLPRADRRKTKLVRSLNAGLDDMLIRTPETAALASKTALIAGLGCIGAPVAVELSKAGCGTLTLLDPDIAEPGQTARWPVGLQFVGLNKSEGLCSFIKANWPYSRVVAATRRIGTSFSDDEKVVSESDLVVDCSAEEGVQRYLAQLCRQQLKTLIIASTTAGAHGGLIVTFRPEPTEMCYGCWELHQQDSTVPNPPEDAGGHVQPAGCGDPTFTGAGFDVTEVSLMATRAAVGELGRGQLGAYPESWWNTAILAMRKGEALIPPRWDVFFLKPHPSCRERHS